MPKASSRFRSLVTAAAAVVGSRVILRAAPPAFAPRRGPMAAVALALGALALAAGSAAAHVGVTPREVRPNTNETFTVRVPTEKDEPTIKVRVEFPAGLVVSRFQPKPGWQREIERDTAGRITAATWSGGRIEPSEYEDFQFIGRTPPEAGKLSFKAYQTYQGGETVEWVNLEEPRPAAVVEVRAAAGNPSIENPGGATAPAAAGGATAGATVRAGGSASGATPAPATAAPRGAGVERAAGEGAAGSDLPLFVALGAGALALVATAMAGVALARRPQAA